MNVPKSAAKPPGRKLIRRLSLQTKWILLAVCGLLFTLYGLSILVNANAQRLAGTDTSKWLLLGFYSFVFLSGGLLVLGQAFRFRLLLDFRRETRKELSRLKKRIDTKKIKDMETARKRRTKTKNPTK